MHLFVALDQASVLVPLDCLAFQSDTIIIVHTVNENTRDKKTDLIKKPVKVDIC